jgi:hypothetical protein
MLRVREHDTMFASTACVPLSAPIPLAARYYPSFVGLGPAMTENDIEISGQRENCLLATLAALLPRVRSDLVDHA